MKKESKLTTNIIKPMEGAKVMDNSVLPQVEEAQKAPEVQEIPCEKTRDVLIKKGFRPLNLISEKEKKRALLETPMHLLGLGNCFNRYFFDNSEKKYLVEGILRKMDSKDVVTLQEFINMNPVPRGRNALITRRPCFCPKKNSICSDTTSYYKLLDFLKSEGFTNIDWLALTPKGSTPNIESLPKEKIMTIPAIMLLGSYEKCDPVQTLTKYFQKKIKEITVENILTIDNDEVEKIIVIVRSLQRMQRRLRRFGFRDTDGPFMRAHLDFW